MFLTGVRPMKAQREALCGMVSASDIIAARTHGDPAKEKVMTYLGQLVSDGFAEWKLLESGDIELRFQSGEIFHLADTALTRVA
jgi:hypothetical protein